MAADEQTTSSPSVVARPGDQCVAFDIQEEQHPLPAIYAAGHCFLDRCLVSIHRSGPDTLVLNLAARGVAEDDGVWEAISEDFVDELRSETFRRQVAEANASTMDAVLIQALVDPTPAPLLDDADLDDDSLDDPLGIAQSWEDRYAPKKDDDAADAAAEDA